MRRALRIASLSLAVPVAAGTFAFSAAGATHTGAQTSRPAAQPVATSYGGHQKMYFGARLLMYFGGKHAAPGIVPG